jgi:hypothetical protein
MVPTEYHEFLTGAITVAGALVGLLFVAISGPSAESAPSVGALAVAAPAKVEE